ncbi:uncharacterized protein LOC105172809 [Sesamum indicum]|uniref:Uncharacterized protein LOC105172809 n=1 Tax=Sesamum indicum TaxID=4182 RepID=A0A6I9U1K7_SESIN|nr:uncharacterized protein LOC105172809 [Sesamum indicum]
MWWRMGSKSNKKNKNKNKTRTESRMDIEEILKMKLETINEEAETPEEKGAAAHLTMKHHLRLTNKVKKTAFKIKMGKLPILTSQFSLKDSYLLFITGFSSKAGLGGLPPY